VTDLLPAVSVEYTTRMPADETRILLLVPSLSVPVKEQASGPSETTLPVTPV
jgi:hypothetical protein